MRGYLLAYCATVLVALLLVKTLATCLRQSASSSEHPPTTAIEFRAGAARQWLVEHDGEVTEAVLRARSH